MKILLVSAVVLIQWLAACSESSSFNSMPSDMPAQSDTEVAKEQPTAMAVEDTSSSVSISESEISEFDRDDKIVSNREPQPSFDIVTSNVQPETPDPIPATLEPELTAKKPQETAPVDTCAGIGPGKLVTDVDTAFKIRAVDDFVALRQKLTEADGNLNVILCNDIDFAGRSFGQALSKFSGKFDGRGFSIININTSVDSSLFFGKIVGGQISSLHFKNIIVKFDGATSTYLGLLASTIEGAQIEDVSFTDSVMSGAKQIIGMLAGQAQQLIAKDLLFKNVTLAATGRIIGIVAGEVVASQIRNVRIEQSKLLSDGNGQCYPNMGFVAGVFYESILQNAVIGGLINFLKSSQTCRDPVAAIGSLVGHSKGLSSSLSTSVVDVRIDAEPMPAGTTRIGGVAGVQNGGSSNAISGSVRLSGAAVNPTYSFNYNKIVAYNDSGAAINTDNTISFSLIDPPSE